MVYLLPGVYPVALTLPTEGHPLPYTCEGMVTTSGVEIFAGLSGRTQPVAVDFYTTSSDVQVALCASGDTPVYVPVPADTHWTAWERGPAAHGSKIYVKTASGSHTLQAILR
ncbi:MAG: hypothetical protein EBR73_16200 [Rhodobacteraceae bacterium]|nr:hypothetical protein [Paracoccaceae bacterium]